jgi:hypothetical protein
MFWQCQQAAWLESIAAEPEDIPAEECLAMQPEREEYLLDVDTWPNEERYWRLVRMYTRRDLTFESDAARAFSAVIDLMSRSFPGGFHWGIPAFYFDLGLLWTSPTPLKRRAQFPSWSWMGWKGEIMGSKLDHRISPTGVGHRGWNDMLQTDVSWHACKAAGDQPIHIDNGWHQYRAMKDDPADLLPPGWYTREADGTEIFGNTDGSQNGEGILLGDGDYDEDGGPDTNTQGGEDEDGDDNGSDYAGYRVVPKRLFCHPLVKTAKQYLPFVYLNYPVPITEQPLGPFPHAWLPFLCFSTTKQDFIFRGTGFNPEPRYGKSHCLWADLQTQNGTWAGVVETNLSMDTDVRSLKGRVCEMILVFTQIVMQAKTANHHCRELQFCDALKDLQTYECCNVLWVEWQDGIAFRKGIGRILKKVWDLNPGKQVDVTMG